MSNVLFIVTEDFAPGFKLSGVDIAIYDSSDKVRERIEEEILKPKYLLIIVEERLFQVGDRFYKRLKKMERPIVYSLRLSYRWEREKEKEGELEALIRSAIGYEIRLT